MNIDKFFDNPSKSCIFESDYSSMIDEPVMLGVSNSTLIILFILMLFFSIFNQD